LSRHLRYAVLEVPQLTSKGWEKAGRVRDTSPKRASLFWSFGSRVVPLPYGPDGPHAQGEVPSQAVGICCRTTARDIDAQPELSRPKTIDRSSTASGRRSACWFGREVGARLTQAHGDAGMPAGTFSPCASGLRKLTLLSAILTSPGSRRGASSARSVSSCPDPTLGICMATSRTRGGQHQRMTGNQHSSVNNPGQAVSPPPVPGSRCPAEAYSCPDVPWRHHFRRCRGPRHCQGYGNSTLMAPLVTTLSSAAFRAALGVADEDDTTWPRFLRPFDRSTAESQRQKKKKQIEHRQGQSRNTSRLLASGSKSVLAAVQSDPVTVQHPS